jgi:dihydroorotate dehydrogenase
MKLSPNVTDITETAKAAEAAGAECTVINQYAYRNED